MTTQRSVHWLRLVTAFMAVSLIIFLCFFFTAMVVDSVFGDKLIMDQLLYASKRDLWSQFWSDWRDSLVPLFVLVSAWLATGISLHFAFKLRLCWILPILALVLVATIIQYIGTESLIPLIAAGLIASLISCWLLGKCISVQT